MKGQVKRAPFIFFCSLSLSFVFCSRASLFRLKRALHSVPSFHLPLNATKARNKEPHSGCNWCTTHDWLVVFLLCFVLIQFTLPLRSIVIELNQRTNEQKEHTVTPHKPLKRRKGTANEKEVECWPLVSFANNKWERNQKEEEVMLWVLSRVSFPFSSCFVLNEWNTNPNSKKKDKGIKRNQPNHQETTWGNGPNCVFFSEFLSHEWAKWSGKECKRSASL